MEKNREIIDLEDLNMQKDTSLLPDIQALSGERWFPKETEFIDDLPLYWGDWGCSSEVGKLKAVLLRRPGKEVENFDFEKVRYRAPIDVDLFRKQHDDLADVYRKHGAKVYYIEEQREDRPNAVFVRDQVFMTPEGAIVTRPAMSERRGEERYAAQALAKIGVPIIKTISGDGIFEGANAMWVDRKTVILSLASRTNRSGYDQVASELTRMGVTEIIPMQIPYGHAHIDGLMNIASHDTALVFATQVPYVVVDALKRKGYRILEVPSQTEAKFKSACNFVALEPGKIVTGVNSPRTREVLEKAGIEVITVDVRELNKGRGSMHCMTAFLKRED